MGVHIYLFYFLFRFFFKNPLLLLLSILVSGLTNVYSMEKNNVFISSKNKEAYGSLLVSYIEIFFFFFTQNRILLFRENLIVLTQLVFHNVFKEKWPSFASVEGTKIRILTWRVILSLVFMESRVAGDSLCYTAAHCLSLYSTPERGN